MHVSLNSLLSSHILFVSKSCWCYFRNNTRIWLHPTPPLPFHSGRHFHGWPTWLQQSLLTGLLASTLTLLQSYIHTAVRNFPSHHDLELVSPLLSILQWLPFHWQWKPKSSQGPPNRVLLGLALLPLNPSPTLHSASATQHEARSWWALSCQCSGSKGFACLLGSQICALVYRVAPVVSTELVDIIWVVRKR